MVPPRPQRTSLLWGEVVWVVSEGGMSGFFVAATIFLFGVGHVRWKEN